MVEACFRKPKEGEVAKLMNSKMLLTHIQHQYPSVDINHGNLYVRCARLIWHTYLPQNLVITVYQC